MTARAPRGATGKARVRVFICHKCRTAEQVPWCGQRPNCGHPDCIAALEECASTNRDPSDSQRFHGPVTLAQIDEVLYSVTDEAR
jgi:predicted ATP-dependent serine protease